MRQSRNILTDKEMELVGLLMQDCQSTGDIQSKLKRLFAGTIEQMLEAEMEEHLGYEKPALKAITQGILATGTIARPSSAITARAKLPCPGTATAILSRKSLKRGRHGRMKSNKKLWRCIQRG